MVEKLCLVFCVGNVAMAVVKLLLPICSNRTVKLVLKQSGLLTASYSNRAITLYYKTIITVYKVLSLLCYAAVLINFTYYAQYYAHVSNLCLGITYTKIFVIKVRLFY